MAWTITEDSARSFKFPADEFKADKIKFDDKFPGFGLRIRTDAETGREHRSYIFQYKFGSKHRRLNCGTVGKVTAEDARKAAKKHSASIVNDKDPAATRKAVRKEASNTLQVAIASYLEAKKDEWRSRSYTQVKQYLENCWKPLYDLPIRNIERAHIAPEIGKIAKQRGNVSANRARACLSAFFRWAIGEGLCDQNPVVGTNKQEENGPRQRVLIDENGNPAEAAAVWRACSDNDFGRIVKLLLLTGCRRDEIGALRWSEIDTEAKTLTLPAGRTKNKTEHVVPLSDLALAVLKEIPRRAERDLIFGRSEDGFTGWSKSKNWLDEKLSIPEWTLHDLRRTVRTGLGKIGIVPHVCEAVLNHLPPKLVRTYDRNSYFDEKRDALKLWATHLQATISPKTNAIMVRAVASDEAAPEQPRASFAERMAAMRKEPSEKVIPLRTVRDF